MGIHGIAQEFGGRYSLEQVWLAAVRDGLAAAGHHVKAESLTDRHLHVAFYGDLFRRPGTMGGADFPHAYSDISRGLEFDLLSELYHVALKDEGNSAMERGTAERMSAGRVTAQVMVEHLLRTKIFAGIAQRVFVGSLKQVALFLSDEPTKQRVIENARSSVTDDTRVIIGHSMGSIVAYEYLCRYQPSGVKLLITMGSPLGIRNLIFDRLTPAPVAGVGIWPGELPTWVNVADPNDFVAMQKKLTDLWRGQAPAREVTDREVDNGSQPHDAARYLNSRQTGTALGDALE